jgi:hypothetical protein
MRLDHSSPWVGSRLSVFARLVACFALVACGASEDSAADAGAGVDAEMFEMAGGFVGCETATPYEPGLTILTASGEYEVRLLSAAPAPPDVEENAWTLAVAPAGSTADDALSDVEIAVEPWMPGHGHGVFPPEALGVSGEDGVAVIDGFNIIMPGFWEFRVRLTLADGTTDTALFAFCVRG